MAFQVNSLPISLRERIKKRTNKKRKANHKQKMTEKIQLHDRGDNTDENEQNSQIQGKDSKWNNPRVGNSLILERQKRLASNSTGQ